MNIETTSVSRYNTKIMNVFKVTHKQEASEQLSYDKVTGDDAAIYCRNNGDKPGTDAAFLRQDTLGDPAHCAQEER